MSLPNLSHLQFQILDCMASKEITGRDLRAALKEKGIKKSGPAFYQLMSRLEDSDFVKKRIEPKNVEGHEIKESLYKISGLGVEARYAAYQSYADSNTAKLGGTYGTA